MVRLLQVIDEAGNQLREETVDKIHQEKLLHRSVHVIVVNNKGKIFLRRRSFKKKLYPGVWTTSVGVHVFVGESPDEAAQRGLKNILGLTVPVEKIVEEKVQDEMENELTTLYISYANSIPNLNPQEAHEGRFMTIEEIKKLISEGKTTPFVESALTSYENLKK